MKIFAGWTATRQNTGMWKICAAHCRLCLWSWTGHFSSEEEEAGLEKIPIKALPLLPEGLTRSLLFFTDVCPTCPSRLPAMEIHALKWHLIFLGSVLYLQYMEAMPLPFFSYLLLFTRKVFRGRGYCLSFTDTPQWEFITDATRVASLDATQVAKGESSKWVLRRWWSTIERRAEMNAYKHEMWLSI